MTEKKTHRKPWWLKWLVGTVLPISLLALGLWGFERASRAKLDKVMREARQGGLPLTFEEIEAVRRTWPDDENGALVIQPVLDRLAELEDDEGLKALPWVGEGDEPALGHRWTQAQEEVVSTQLERFAPELAVIDRLARCEGGRFALEIKPNPLDTLLPALDTIRCSLKLKSLQIVNHVMRGETGSTVADFRVLNCHGQLLADEPVLISALVRIACEHFLVNILEKVCAQATLDPEQLREIDAILASLDDPTKLYWGLLGDRASFVRICEWVSYKGCSLAAIHSGNSNIQAPEWMSFGGVPGLRGWLVRDQAKGLQLYSELVRAAKDPIKATKIAAEVEQEVKNLPKYYLVSKMLMSSLCRSFVIQNNTTAKIRCARAALAVERYRIDHGRFPVSLEEVVPGYLDTLLLDPFDEKPLRYRLTDREAIVYSLGEDGIDNQGEVEHRTKQEKVPGDLGFILLMPEDRGLPALEPAYECQETASTQAAVSQPD